MIKSLYEKFKHWSDGGKVWLFSDPHFADEESILLNPDYLPAKSPKTYVDIINKSVGKCDTVVCLGDVGDVKYIQDIKCRYKVLILGNHDHNHTYYEPYFDEIYEGAVFVGSKLLLSHEPVNGLKFCCNVHGHCHNFYYAYKDHEGGRHLNIAADVVNYQILDLDRLIKSGLISNLPTIHRIAIDKQKEKKNEN